jgi:hypothetical protein
VVVQGQVNVDSSVVRDVIGDGAIVADGGTGVVSNSVLRGSRVQGNLARGHGVIAFQGGALRVTGSSLIDHESVGAVCQNDKSTLELRDSVIVGPATSAQAPDEQLRVSSEKSGIGAVVTDKATLRMEGVVVLRAQGFGIQVDQTSATVPRVYVLDTQLPARRTAQHQQRKPGRYLCGARCLHCGKCSARPGHRRRHPYGYGLRRCIG